MGFSGVVWGTGDVRVQWCGSSVEMWVMWVPESSVMWGALVMWGAVVMRGCSGDVG